MAARSHRRQQARRIVRHEHDEGSAGGLLERFEERILGVFRERLGFLEDGDLAASAKRLAAQETLYGSHLFDEYALAPFSSIVYAEPLTAQIGVRSRGDLHAAGAASASFA